ncbi:hypothetical protein CHLNCDRAFT_140072 [Chlorella variabilis]|uniref:Peptidase M20 dimerisation domain-containing protein n=1 Tax=Chlorella variabilis TaxID=554065 RepID=E1ZRI8_CHLVA|nr:hypothetical protein CHLNCDRAFT_140072 [Chlorella variabilis]EFN51633.1 hypothetical protein CHLNCDRAFT_140072 [Chlorella variabilis]|eukprot:XP_005843735.1 hypothetical protein CHLNCDRAFT_140072 [Chlorella variabilis]
MAAPCARRGAGAPWALLVLALLASPLAAALKLDIDGQAIVDQLLHLATYSDDPNPAVTRILFTENDMKARGYIKQLMAEAGLTIREDTMGDIYGVLPGANPGAASVSTGSHCDAIPLAGAYDGTLGVVGGIAALRALKEAGFVPAKPLEVVMFTSEEPTRFALSCSGSRAMAGVLDAGYLDSRRDENGTSYLAAATAAGYGAATYGEMLQGARRTPADLAAFVELHIEQGPLLEKEGTQIGIVTAIAAPAALRVSFSGDGGHAGAQLMPWRNDASLAAAELALFVEHAALSAGSWDTVATAGYWDIKPNAVNSVPREAVLEIDVRDIDRERRDGGVGSIREEAAKIAQRRKVRHSVDIINQDPPATSAPAVVAAAAAAVSELGYSSKRMVSRAYHDSLFMAQIAPTAMIFIPCRNGWSHRPDEYASPADIARGVQVLAHTMARLAGDAADAKQEL